MIRSSVYVSQLESNRLWYLDLRKKNEKAFNNFFSPFDLGSECVNDEKLFVN